MRKESIIDIKNGNVYGKGKEETIILKGDYLHEDSNYIERATIVLRMKIIMLKNMHLNLTAIILKFLLENFLVTIVMTYMFMEKQVNQMDMQWL